MLQRQKCRLAWCCFQFAANFQNQQCQLALLLSFKRICVALHVTLFLSMMPVKNCCWIGQLRDSETKAKRRWGRGRSFKCHLFDFLVGAQSPRHTPPDKTSTKNEKRKTQLLIFYHHFCSSKHLSEELFVSFSVRFRLYADSITRESK